MPESRRTASQHPRSRLPSQEELRAILTDAIEGTRPARNEPPQSDPSDEPEVAAALGDASLHSLRGPGMSASSSLDPEHAVRLARLICACTPGSSYCYILPTGSMQPLFGEKVILLLESVPFNTLHVGDIITYRHPRSSNLIVHRLVGHDYERFRSKGDANRFEDDVCVTRTNYRQRVFGIIYLNSAPE